MGIQWYEKNGKGNEVLNWDGRNGNGRELERGDSFPHTSSIYRTGIESRDENRVVWSSYVHSRSLEIAQFHGAYMTSYYTPFTRYNRLSNRLYNRLSNRFWQPVVKPVVQPDWQSAGCLFTQCSRLSIRLYNWTAGCQTGLTTGWMFV